MTTASHTISLRVWSIKEDKAPLKASKDVTPGMWLEFSSGAVQPHSNASAVPSPKIVAVEAPYRSGAGIETAYDVDGEEVDFHYAQSGEQFFCLLAAGEDISAGDLLESDGAGGVQAGASTFLRALEDVDNSASYEYARIRVEVL
jgi:hypothetical protein